MKPQTLFVLGAGAFMFLLFVIIGSVAWLKSDGEVDDKEDDDKKDDNNNNNNNNNNNDNDNNNNNNNDDDDDDDDDDNEGYDWCTGGLVKHCNVGSREQEADPNTMNFDAKIHERKRKRKCPNTFMATDGSESGYAQCQWNTNHCSSASAPGVYNECKPSKYNKRDGDGKTIRCADSKFMWWDTSIEEECECEDEDWIEEHSDGEGRWRCRQH